MSNHEATTAPGIDYAAISARAVSTAPTLASHRLATIEHDAKRRVLATRVAATVAPRVRSYGDTGTTATRALSSTRGMRAGWLASFLAR